MMIKKKRKKRKFVFLLLLVLLVGSSYVLYQTKKEVDEVNKWDEEVTIATEKYNISEYKDIVLGIIYTESRGLELDVMQSSESKYGEQEKMGSSAESIDSGVQFLAEGIQKARQANCDIWTAVQAYNFGLSYIDYVQDHGGTNTVALSEEYSRTVLAPTLGNDTLTKYRYWKLQAILYNGGYLYHDGGNFFYAELVQRNMKILQFFS